MSKVTASSKITVLENVLRANDQVAQINRRRLTDAGVFTVNLIGAPGCGKTTLMERTLELTSRRWRTGVIAGDLATPRDAERLGQFTSSVIQVNTGRGCHLEAPQIAAALDHLELEALDLLVIENVGNLICPVAFDLGENAKVGVFSVTEGDDKAAKHPHLVAAASLLLLNKTDLEFSVSFQFDRFMEDVRRLNASVPLMRIAARAAQLTDWIKWLEQRVHSLEKMPCG